MSPDIPTPSRTILIVDERNDVRLQVRSALEAGGYKTLQAADGLVGWQTLTRHRDRIDLLIISFDLPGLSGGALVELARELWPRLPVLLLSDQPHAHITRTFPTLKQISFLRKPFSSDELMAVVLALFPPGKRT